MAHTNTATATPRVTVRGLNRGNVHGFSITSRAGGIFGTKIFVRHLSTAIAIKAIVQAQSPTRSADIDRLMREDATRGTAVASPSPALRLVWSR